MKTFKSKQKKTASKKTHSLLVEKGLKKIKAQELSQKLAKSNSPVIILFGKEKFEISENVKRQFIDALIDVANLSSTKKERSILSTQEVADLLNVSRPYVVKLIDSKKLKAFEVGTHRRVYESDALEFKKQMRGEQNNALDELAKETENLGIKFR